MTCPTLRLVAILLCGLSGVLTQYYQHQPDYYQQQDYYQPQQNYYQQPSYQQPEYQQYGNHQRYYRSVDDVTTPPPTPKPTVTSVHSVNKTEVKTDGKLGSGEASKSSGDSFPNLDIIDDADVVMLPDGTTEIITDRPPTTIRPGQQETRDTSRQDPDHVLTTSTPTTSMPTTTPSHLSIIEMLFGLTSDEGSNATNTTANQTHEEVIKVVKRQAPPVLVNVQQSPQPIPQQPPMVLLTPPQQIAQQPLQQSQFLQQQAVASNQFRGQAFILPSLSPGQPTLLVQPPPLQQVPSMVLDPLSGRQQQQLEQVRFVVQSSPGQTVQQQPMMLQAGVPQQHQQSTPQQTPQLSSKVVPAPAQSLPPQSTTPQQTPQQSPKLTPVPVPSAPQMSTPTAVPKPAASGSSNNQSSPSSNSLKTREVHNGGQHQPKMEVIKPGQPPMKMEQSKPGPQPMKMPAPAPVTMSSRPAVPPSMPAPVVSVPMLSRPPAPLSSSPPAPSSAMAPRPSPVLTPAQVSAISPIQPPATPQPRPQTSVAPVGGSPSIGSQAVGGPPMPQPNMSKPPSGLPLPPPGSPPQSQGQPPQPPTGQQQQIQVRPPFVPAPRSSAQILDDDDFPPPLQSGQALPLPSQQQVPGARPPTQPLQPQSAPQVQVASVGVRQAPQQQPSQVPQPSQQPPQGPPPPMQMSQGPPPPPLGQSFMQMQTLRQAPPPQPPTAPSQGLPMMQPGLQMVPAPGQGSPMMPPMMPPMQQGPSVNQLAQRSVPDADDLPLGRSNMPAPRTSGSRFRREAAPYPTQDAYDTYVVNRYHDQYPSETYPVYSYTTASYYATTTPKVEYYSSYSSRYYK